MQLATQFTNRTARTLALAFGFLTLAPTVVCSQDDLAQREIQRVDHSVRAPAVPAKCLGIRLFPIDDAVEMRRGESVTKVGYLTSVPQTK